MARWEKLGRLYKPCVQHPKLASHAANPIAVPLSGDVYRVFYSGRDDANRSSVGFVDVDVVARKLVHVHDRPVFEHGREGSFYSHGVSVGGWYEADRKRYICFMGWQVPAAGHWRGDIGRLVLAEDGSLTLDREVPFLESDAVDPVSVSYPWVCRMADGTFRMWYGSTIVWDAGNGEMLHVINHAISEDGHSWRKRGLAVPFELGRVQAFSRPTVVGSEAEGFRMWFSYRGGGDLYRIGYAVSRDGEAWALRLDQTGIDVSRDGWDSAMIEYPFVFHHAGEIYMLYNGDGYGRTGFGLAIWNEGE